MPKDLSVQNKTLGLQQLSENTVPQFPFCVSQSLCSQFLLLNVISYRTIQRQERGEKKFLFFEILRIKFWFSRPDTLIFAKWVSDYSFVSLLTLEGGGRY